MKQLLAFMFVICTSLGLCAQESVTEIKKLAFENPFSTANQNLINMINREEASAGMRVMLFNRWQPMDAVGQDSTQLHIDSANYHILTDKILFLSEAKLYELFPEKVSGVRLGVRTFITLPLKANNRVKSHYFELLVRGDYFLLARFEMKKKVTSTNPMGLPGTNEEKYVRDEKFYYLRTGARFPELVPTKKKDFILIFRKNRPQMASFAKEKKISLRSKEDLEVAFRYYNKLINPNAEEFVPVESPLSTAMLNRADVATNMSLMLFDQWQRMDALGIDSSQLRLDSANYNVALDRILFMNLGKLYEIFPDKIMHVKIGQHTFVTASTKTNESTNQYFELLEQGEYDLLAKFELKNKESSTNPMGLPGSTERKSVKEEKFFYLKEGARCAEIVPTNKKDFIFIFGKKGPQMDTYIKENKVSLRSEEDLKATFAYFNKIAIEQ